MSKLIKIIFISLIIACNNNIYTFEQDKKESHDANINIEQKNMRDVCQKRPDKPIRIRRIDKFSPLAIDLNNIALSYINGFKEDNSFTNEHAIESLCLLPNGNLASGSSSEYVGQHGVIQIWDVNTGQCIKTLVGHKYNITSLCLLRNGYLASGAQDKTIKIWDISTGKCVNTLTGHANGIKCLCLLSNDNLVSGSYDDTIKVWDTSTGRCLRTLKKNLNNYTISFCLLPNNYLASGSSFGTIEIYNTNTWQCEQTLTGHKYSVISLCLLQNGYLASGSWDEKIKIWDINTGQCVKTLNAGIITALSLLQNSYLISSSSNKDISEDNIIKVWNINTGQCLHTLYGHAAPIRSLCLAKNGYLISGSEDKTIKIWDTNQQYDYLSQLVENEDQQPLSENKELIEQKEIVDLQYENQDSLQYLNALEAIYHKKALKYATI